MKRVKYGEMFELFYSITTGLGFTESKAMTAAGIFTDNSCDGVYSHLSLIHISEPTRH